MGDFNYNDINWNTLSGHSSNSQEFVETINDLFLTQHVKKATKGQNILDLIFSSEPDMVDDLEIRSSVANSDHNVIMFKLIYETTVQKENMKVFNYHHGNYLQICNELQLVNWDNRFYEKMFILCGLG